MKNKIKPMIDERVILSDDGILYDKRCSDAVIDNDNPLIQNVKDSDLEILNKDEETDLEILTE